MKTLLLPFLILLPAILSAQPWSLELLREPYGGAPYSIASSPNGTLYVGEYGTGIYRSTDDGRSWQALYPSTSSLAPIGAFDNGTIFATYGDQMLYRNYSQFGTWRRYEFYGPMGAHYITAAQLFGSILVIGTENGVGISLDTGRTWQRSGFEEKQITDIAVAESTIVAVADRYWGNDTVTYLARSFDTAQTWQRIEIGYRRSLPVVEAGGSGVAVHFRDSGLYFWRTSDSLPVLIDSSEEVRKGSVLGVSRSDEIMLVNTSLQQLILFEAVTGVRHDLPLPFWGRVATDIARTKSGALIVTTNEIGLFRSDDNGTTWSWSGMEGAAWINDLLPLPGGQFLASVREQGILRMDRSGSGQLFGRSDTPYSSLALDSNGGFWGLKGKELYHSTDLGASWTAVETGSKNDLNALVALPDNTLLLATAYDLLRSTDGGGTWEQSLGPGGISILRLDGSGIVWGEGYDRLVQSTDGGETWQTWKLTNLGFSGGFAGALGVTPSGTVVVQSTGPSAHFIRSTDGGKTWSTRPAICDFASDNILWTSHGLLAFTYCGIFLSSDEGDTWYNIAPNDARFQFSSVVEHGLGEILVGTEVGLYSLRLSLSVEDGVLRWMPSELDMW